MLAKCLTAKREVNIILNPKSAIRCGIFHIKVKRIKHDLNKKLDATIEAIIALI